MDFIATQKFLRLSPRKIRVVASMIKKMSPSKAIEVLPLIVKRSSLPLQKVIKTAIGNAKVKGVSEAELIIKEIQVSEGPRLKRGMPVSRGRWHPYKKRMSHIRVVLTTQNPKLQTQNSKQIENSKDGNSRFQTKEKGKKAST